MRIVIVINKWWECEPAIAAMLNSNVCPPGAPWQKVLSTAATGTRMRLAVVEGCHYVCRCADLRLIAVDDARHYRRPVYPVFVQRVLRCRLVGIGSYVRACRLSIEGGDGHSE